MPVEVLELVSRFMKELIIMFPPKNQKIGVKIVLNFVTAIFWMEKVSFWILSGILRRHFSKLINRYFIKWFLSNWEQVEYNKNQLSVQ